MLEIKRFNKILMFLILFGDIILLNLLFAFFIVCFGERFWAQGYISPSHGAVLMTLCYAVCTMQTGVVLHRPVIRIEQIVTHVFRNIILFALLSITLLSISHWAGVPSLITILFYLVYGLVNVLYRIVFRYFLKIYRRKGGNRRGAVLVGAHENMQELYHVMTDDITSGYHVLGYFDDFPFPQYSEKIEYLGQPHEVIAFLERHRGRVEQVYCSLPSARSEEIVPIINYCENHLIRFFSVPNVRNYLKRRMWFELLGNVPVLSIHREPLTMPENRILKRAFDLVCSLLFIFTLFPFIYLIVGAAIRLNSPGPIFFKQRRSGEDGREFWCYKFRSMRMNKDSDVLQATENDPRKTRVGEFIRKTSIDELPQFINVLKGDMSIVGPRPHMLKHTEEYARLINKFMVRHFAKPGITGWAQVSGFRGETKELWQMEGRVMRDIWYIENWTFVLDLYIIYRTVRNALRGEKEAY